MFAAVLATQLEGGSHPDFHQWVNGLTKHGEYACDGILSAMKSSEVLTQAATAVKLKDVILCERSQMPKTTCVGAEQSGGSQHLNVLNTPELYTPA